MVAETLCFARLTVHVVKSTLVPAKHRLEELHSVNIIYYVGAGLHLPKSTLRAYNEGV